MSENAERQRMLREVARKTVVYRIPGMEAIPVRRDVVFEARSGAALPMDLYYPTLSPERPLPVVLMPMAFSVPSERLRAYGPLTSWAQLLAASGIVAAVYGTDVPADDVHPALRHLRGDAASLRIDPERLGLFAVSANVTVALAALMRERHVKCAAMLYGFTLDMEGSTLIADAAAQAGFVNACVGLTVDDLPADVPMLFVRAGQDHFPGLNIALDRVIQQALARNLPLWFVNHAAGRHGFDLDDDSPLARGLVQHVLAFLQLHLNV